MNGSDADATAILKTLWRRRTVVLLAGAAAAILAAIYAFLAPPVYTAETTFLPRMDEPQPNLMLGQLVSLAGLSLEQGGAYEALYGRIILSDRVLDTLLTRTWPDELAGQERKLVAILGDETDDPRAVLKTKRRLRRDWLSFARDKTTGFMRLQVSLERRPRLAADLANHLTDELDRYLGESSRSRAGNQRSFVEDRLEAVQRELRSAEQALVEFERDNRAWSSSPPLTMQHGELRREVEVQSTLWVELRRQQELARIDEHKDIVRLEILDRATPPLDKSAPRRGLFIVLGAALGVVLASLFVLLRAQQVRA